MYVRKFVFCISIQRISTTYSTRTFWGSCFNFIAEIDNSFNNLILCKNRVDGIREAEKANFDVDKILEIEKE